MNAGTEGAESLPVTVVVATRNRPALAAAALRSIISCRPAPADVVVVDQSDDWSIELTEPGGTSDVPVRHLRTHERGLSRAVSVGVRAARHDTVLITHDDVLVDPGWVAAMARAAERAGPDTVLTGRIVAGAAEATDGFAPSLADHATPRRYVGRLGYDVLKPLNMAVDRTTYASLDGFDVRLGPGTRYPGAEDADFGFRALEAGLAIEFVPDAVVTHRAWRPGTDYLAVRWSYGFAHGAFYAKHLSRRDVGMVRRFADDLLRRARRFPRRLVAERWRALGDPTFVVANLAGGLDFAVRHRWMARPAMPPPDDPAPYRPHIAPVVDDGGPRPTWSVMVPTYNCADYLVRTLASIVAAIGDRDDVHVEVVDDCSADHPELVVAAMNDRRISFHRQESNVGHTANFNTCLTRSRGHFVHLLHGDDLVRPGFYEAAEAAFGRHHHVGAAFCRHEVIDEHDVVFHVARPVRPSAGVLDGWLDEIAVGNRLQAPTMTVRRSTFERVGGFDRRIPSYGEDWEMWVRLAAATAVHYDPRPLAAYRVRRSNLTDGATATGDNIDQLRLVARLNRAVLPADRRDRLTRAADRNSAYGALRRAVRLFDQGDRNVALAQTRAALRTSHAPLVIWMTFFGAVRIGFRVMRRFLQRLGLPV